MAIVKHLKVTALGRFDGTPERWSYSINFHMDGGPDEWNLITDSSGSTSWYSDVANDFKLFHADPPSRIHPKAVLETVKLAVIVPDELGKPKYQKIGGAYNMREVNVVDTPGGASRAPNELAHVIPQAALAVTLQSGRSGPSGRGRFYLPMPTTPLEGDLRISVDNANSVAASVRTLFQNIANQPFVDLPGATMAPTVASSKGYNTPVTSVKVGRVIDTIRSRRNALAEGYVFTPVVQ
jgi:hypothetical protein